MLCVVPVAVGGSLGVSAGMGRNAISTAGSPELNLTWSVWCWVVWNLNSLDKS